jgi:hypothetical protein
VHVSLICDGGIQKAKIVAGSWDRKERLRVDVCPERLELLP